MQQPPPFSYYFANTSATLDGAQSETIAARIRAPSVHANLVMLYQDHPDQTGCYSSPVTDNKGPVAGVSPSDRFSIFSAVGGSSCQTSHTLPHDSLSAHSHHGPSIQSIQPTHRQQQVINIHTVGEPPYIPFEATSPSTSPGLSPILYSTPPSLSPAFDAATRPTQLTLPRGILSIQPMKKDLMVTYDIKRRKFVDSSNLGRLTPTSTITIKFSSHLYADVFLNGRPCTPSNNMNIWFKGQLLQIGNCQHAMAFKFFNVANADPFKRPTVSMYALLPTSE
ncbi:hypothetical protein BT69DRAFT_1323495 [Atractiella rhizophila]|nr:hypothetical protein BT69DRAFT_1323495 [Atractiella rhizophila]